MKKSIIPSISILRVLAMLSIILGHWCASVGINDYQLLAIGVEMFLFLSGYLYGKKEIKNSKEWLISRWKKLIIPFWVVLASISLVSLVVFHKLDFIHLIMDIFNVQGINRVFLFLDTGSIDGMGQTWFLSVLMVCYFIMLFLKNTALEKKIREYKMASLILIIMLQFVFLLIKVQIVYIVCFFLGYFWKDIGKVGKRRYIVITCFFVIICSLRIYTRDFLDGTVIYDQVIARWSFVFLAIWMIITISIFCNKCLKLTEKIANSYTWRILDYFSYPLFLTHFMFLDGKMALCNYMSVVDELI